MILFLDPQDDIAADKNISESKFISLFSKQIKSLNDYLLKVPENIIDIIDEVGLVVWTDNQYDFVIKNLNKIKTLLKDQSKKNSSLSLLYTKIQIFNNGNNVDRLLNSGIIGTNNVIFFDFSLTHDIALYLIGAQTLTGYRTIIERKEIKFEEIKDTDKYLLIALALYYNSIGVDTVKDRLLKIRNNSKYDAVLLAKKELEFGELNKFRFIVVDPDTNRYKNFIDYVQTCLGPLYLVVCEKDQYYLPRNEEKVLIVYLEKLSLKKRTELMNKIVIGDYSERLVIIIDSVPGALEGFPQFREWYIWPDNERTNTLENMHFRPIAVADQIRKEATKIQYFLDRVLEDKKMHTHLSAITNQITMSGDQIMPGLVDFWYDLNDFETESKEIWLQRLREKIDDYIIGDDLVSKIAFRLYHDKLKGVWIIEKDGKIIKEFSYSSSKGIKYIAYLEKYYKTRTISDTLLRKVIDTWHGSPTKTAESSTDAKKILQDLKYLFEKQCIELAPLNECLEISSIEPGCYFQRLEKISIEIIDEDIPKPIYK